MAADIISVGFGSSPSAVVTGSTNGVICRFIPSQPQHIVRIRLLRVTGIQVAGGAVLATTYAGISVIRCSAQIPQTKTPYRPNEVSANGQIVGLPILSDIAPFDLLYQDLIRLQDPAIPVAIPENVLYAQDGAQLVVVVSAMIDGTVVAPTVTDNGALALTVGGDDIFWPGGSEVSQFPIGSGQGMTRSMPKWDLR